MSVLLLKFVYDLFSYVVTDPKNYNCLESVPHLNTKQLVITNRKINDTIPQRGTFV